MKQIVDFGLRLAVWGLRLLYIPIRCFPQQKKITMISRQSDNPSMDFLLLKKHFAKTHPDYSCVFLCRRLRAGIGYLLHILVQLYHIATSRAVIVDSYCIPVSVLKHKKSLIIIQMWHAIGSMKRFGYAMLGKAEGNRESVAHIMHMHENYTYVLISSLNFIKDYEEGFRMDTGIVREIPLPRVDVLINPEAMQSLREKMMLRYPRLREKKNILYCPTFRKENSLLDEQKVLELIDALDFNRYNLIYKPHPNSRLRISDPRVITFDGQNADILSAADYMISDYSSIIYEAGLAGVPFFLYAYDWNDYQGKRELNIDLAHEVPTVFTDDAAEIVDAIENDSVDRAAMQDFIMRNVTIPESSCCEEIEKLIFAS